MPLLHLCVKSRDHDNAILIELQRLLQTTPHQATPHQTRPSSSIAQAQPSTSSPAIAVPATLSVFGSTGFAQPSATLPGSEALNSSITAQRTGSSNAFPHGLSNITLDSTTEAMLLADPPVQIPLTNDDLMLDELWKNENFDPEYFDLQPEAYYSAAGNTCGFLPNIPEIVDEVDQSDILLSNSASGTPLSAGIFSGSFSDSQLWAPESQLSTSALITSERDHEMAYLIRHFTESLGPW